MSDPFFNQSKAKTHTKSKTKHKAVPLTFTAYEDTKASLEELIEKLAELTGTSENKSATIRTAIAYTLKRVHKDETLLSNVYNKNRSKR